MFTWFRSIPKKTTAIALVLITVFALAALTGFTDDDPVIAKIVSSLDKWLDGYQPEKVYLQFDKPCYAAGDDIWFKAIITAGDHQLSSISGTLNVELVDDRDSVKKWIKLPVKDGITWGDFALPDTIHEGSYRVRAYTNWMRNAGGAYFFDKVIAIGSPVANRVYAASSFTYGAAGKQQKISALVNFTAADGTALSANAVTYQVVLNDKTIASGKGTTDDKGHIQLDFTNNTPDITNGRILTTITLNDKSEVVKTIRIKGPADNVDVQFFPESGYLVNGIRSHVAFKAVGADGLGTDIKGTITDNENNQVIQFSAQHLGMGGFWFTPQAGKTYKAVVTTPAGAQQTVNLPAAIDNGYVLSINNADTASVIVDVISGKPFSSAGQVYVFAQSGGQTRYVAKSNSSASEFHVVIPKSKLPSGITQFTLFSETGQPLNERIVFIQPKNDLLNLKVGASNGSATRQKMKIDLDAMDSNGKLVKGYFAASVIDESKIPADEESETSILSQLLLTSDLRGYIEQPNYYFTNVNENTEANLDILMLTQGYRRFEWKPLLAGTIAPPAFRPEKLMDISGVVTTNAGKPVPNAKITLFTNAGTLFLLDSIADKNGHFTFRNLFIKDSVILVLQAHTPKGSKNVNVKPDHNIEGDKMMVPLQRGDPNDNTQLAAYLKADKKLYDEETKFGLGNHTIVLKQVDINGGKRKHAVQNSSNLNGGGNADQVVGIDYFAKASCSNLEECLQGVLFGVIFKNDIPYLARNVSISDGAMLVVLNGVVQPGTYTGNIFRTLPASEVSSVEVLKTIAYTAAYGNQGSGGILIINLKTGVDAEYAIEHDNYKPGIATIIPKGYYSIRTFYSPRYDDPKTNRTIADLRSTIFWKPDITTDQNGHASFEYYNAGSPGTYRITIEGIDGDGNLGRKVYRYKVE